MQFISIEAASKGLLHNFTAFKGSITTVSSKAVHHAHRSPSFLFQLLYVSLFI